MSDTVTRKPRTFLPTTATLNLVGINKRLHRPLSAFPGACNFHLSRLWYCRKLAALKMGSKFFDSFDSIWTECISRVHQQIYLLRDHPDRQREALKLTTETLKRVMESTQTADFEASMINPMHVSAVKAALREHYTLLSRKDAQKDIIESLQILGHFMQSMRQPRRPKSEVVEQDLRRAMEGMDLNGGPERALVTHDLLHAMESMCGYDPV